MQRTLVLVAVMLILCGCIQQTPRTTTTTTTTLPCTDTDGGRNYLIVGTVSGFDKEGKNFSDTDHCINADQLIEGFCDEVGHALTEPVSCKKMSMLCVRGICSDVTTTTRFSTTTVITTTTTTTTIPGECVSGGCGEPTEVYRCAEDFKEKFAYVEKIATVHYCADAGTPQALCKTKEARSIEDRCRNDEVCVEGLITCQPESILDDMASNCTASNCSTS
jgi:hypothetical protein